MQIVNCVSVGATTKAEISVYEEKQANIIA